MDLAKIRKKARLGQNPYSSVDSNEPVVKETPDTRLQPEEVSAQCLSQNNYIEKTPAPVRETPNPLLRRDTSFNPLQRIIAGREAAGCDDQPTASLDEIKSITNDYVEYLCVRVSDEIYGINIMQLKEIIKPREVTEVPRAPSFVSGIISLRGVIIPILDMLKRLGLTRKSVTGKERVVVVKYGDAFSGLLVDEVIQVIRISKDSFEATPAVLEGIDRDFVSGIGRADNNMIILLNLECIANINLY